jgi:hypothetical protein
MLNVKLDRENRVAVLEATGALGKSDFEAAAAQIDPLIVETGGLAGLIVKVDHFPGWDSFGALVSHMKFIKDHHREVKRIAFVTDSPIGNMAEKLGSHFVAAEIKHFGFQSLVEAKAWILSSSE